MRRSSRDGFLEARQIFVSLRRHCRSSHAFPVSSNDMLVVEGMRTTEFEAREYQLRRHKSYLMMRMTCAEHGYCLNYVNELPTNRIVTTEGESPVACYYFKRIKK